MALLEIKDLKVSYGFISALKGINISVDKGQIVALLGSNGAGKTSTLRAISGAIKPTGGSITLDGVDITAKPTYKIAQAGITQSPEGRLLFAELTVEDNLRIGAYGIKSKVVDGEKKTAKQQQRSYSATPYIPLPVMYTHIPLLLLLCGYIFLISYWQQPSSAEWA